MSLLKNFLKPPNPCSCMVARTYNPINCCKCKEVEQTCDQCSKIQPLNPVIHSLSTVAPQITSIVWFYGNFLQAENEAIFKQCYQNRDLSSNHPNFDVAKSSGIRCFHWVVNICWYEVKCQNHSHSARNLRKWIDLYHCQWARVLLNPQILQSFHKRCHHH